ncbi:MAG: hypothetical protein N4A74_20570 [Carboxylicivirga sp.]|jgi:hypothetical protein|nr:hypothetical protein [Carboxylicivirga sp.]
MQNQTIKFEAFEMLYQEEKEKRMLKNMGVYVPGETINFSDEWVFVRLANNLYGKKIEVITSDGVVIRIDQGDILAGIPSEKDQLEIKKTIITQVQKAVTYTKGQNRLFAFIKFFRGTTICNIYQDHLLSKNLNCNFYLIDNKEVTRFRKYFEDSVKGITPDPEHTHTPDPELYQQPIRTVLDVNLREVRRRKKQKSNGQDYQDYILLALIVISNMFVLGDYLYSYDVIVCVNCYFDGLINGSEATYFFNQYGIYIRAIFKLIAFLLTMNPKRLFTSFMIFLVTFMAFVFIDPICNHFNIAQETKAVSYLIMWLISFFL